MKRTLLVNIESVEEACSILTGYGAIKGIDHEGTITYELEGENEFELGRRTAEIENELRSYFASATITSGKRGNS